MSKRWIFEFRVDPPDETVSVRFGSSVMFGWYSRVFRQWYQVIPGGSLEKIPSPEMIFLDVDYARAHPKDFSKHSPVKLREGKTVQLSLTFE